MPIQKLVCCAASGVKGAEVRIDCTMTDGPCLAAHVVMYAEAKFTIRPRGNHAEAVGQIWVRRLTDTMLCAFFPYASIWCIRCQEIRAYTDTTDVDCCFYQLQQRVEQLGPDQDTRDSWTVAIISQSSIQFWQLQKSQSNCHCSPVLSFSLSLDSPGFQMLCRWLASDSQVIPLFAGSMPAVVFCCTNSSLVLHIFEVCIDMLATDQVLCLTAHTFAYYAAVTCAVAGIGVCVAPASLSHLLG